MNPNHLLFGTRTAASPAVYLFLRAADHLARTVEKLADLIRSAGLSPLAPEDITPFANIKRFLERWSADAQFRASLPEDPQRVALVHGLKADLEEVRPFWDPQTHEQVSRGEMGYAPVVKRFLTFAGQLNRHRSDGTRSIVPADPRFAQWRERQIYRANMEVGAWCVR